MSMAPYAIVNLRDGVRRDVEPFLLDNDGFPSLENCYLFRGRIERKSGYQAVGVDGRLKRQITDTFAGVLAGSTTTSGVLSSIPVAPGTVSVTINSVPPRTFSDIGDGRLGETSAPIAISAITTANPANITLAAPVYLVAGDQVYISDVQGTYELNGNTYIVSNVVGATFDINVDSTNFNPYVTGGTARRIATVGPNFNTINYLTGAFSIFYNALPAGGPYTATVTYGFAPCLPVMGLRTREQSPINDEALIAFDTQKSYQFSSGVNDFIDVNFYKTPGALTNTPFSWTGTDFNFFWTENWRGAMWTTNNVIGNYTFGPITVITAANPAVITLAGHPFQVGDVIGFTHVNGMIEMNGLTGTVTAIAGATFTVNINSAAFTAYTGGGIAYLVAKGTSLAGGTGDGIRWYDGPGTIPAIGWVNFQPPLGNPSDQTKIEYLRGALAIIAYKDRLICFNTFEGDLVNAPINFQQRARWSQNGTPFFCGKISTGAAPTGTLELPTNQGAQQDAWWSDTPGKGGFIDAPTNEVIVSVEFIKDTVIVYFERSTWQLVYTANEVLPFVFQKINTELGCESTFSVVPFDQGIYAVGNYGITNCNSVNVARIDQKIPDEVFDFSNLNNGVQRVYGIRDFTFQLVYWTFPVASSQLKYPSRILMYNYLDGSYANFDDSFTCFGYFQSANDLTWANSNFPWNSPGYTWVSNAEFAKYPLVVAGNQQGFVMIINQSLALYKNSPVLCLDNMTTTANCTITSVNHNLQVGQFVQLVNTVGVTTFDTDAPIDGIYQVMSTTTNTFVIDNCRAFTGVYKGGGTVRIVQNFDIRTKLYNPFYTQGQAVRLTRLEILADSTDSGQISIDYLSSYDVNTVVKSNIMNTSPDNASPSFQDLEEKIWHRVYSNMAGSFIQLSMNLNDGVLDTATGCTLNSQIRNPTISFSDVTLQGLIFYFSPTGNLIG